MRFWDWLKDYFDLTRGERRGIAFLTAIIIVFIILGYLAPYLIPERKEDFAEIRKLSAQLRSHKSEDSDSSPSLALNDLEKEPMRTSSLFAFNPNTATREDFISLGLRPKLAATIINYRNKGGQFRKKEDLKKIYGLSGAEYSRLEPYIIISNNQVQNTAIAKEKLTKPEKPAKAFTPIEINSADSAELTKIRGIGPAFASRIIKYRRMLGGFFRKEQLMEVYGLDSGKFDEIEDQVNADASRIERIDINSTPLEALKKHPYLRYKMANAIVRYREQHGKFSSVEDLRKIKLLDEAVIQKIQPYLSFN